MFSHLLIIFIIRRSNINWCSRIICSPSNKLSGESELRKLFSLTFISSLREHSHPDYCDNRDPQLDNQPLQLIAEMFALFYNRSSKVVSYHRSHRNLFKSVKGLTVFEKLRDIFSFISITAQSQPQILFLCSNVHYNVLVCISIRNPT